MRGSIDLPQFGLQPSLGGDFRMFIVVVAGGGRVSCAQVLRNSRLSPPSAGCVTLELQSAACGVTILINLEILYRMIISVPAAIDLCGYSLPGFRTTWQEDYADVVLYVLVKQ